MDFKRNEQSETETGPQVRPGRDEPWPHSKTAKRAPSKANGGHVLRSALLQYYLLLVPLQSLALLPATNIAY